MLTMQREEIISATEISKNFSACRDKVKKLSRAIIFKNNKPDLALIDIDEYEKMLNIIDLIEDTSILEMVNDRDKRDTGTRYSHDDVMNKINSRLDKNSEHSY